MAAVLCNACGEIASGACDVCAQICQIPCKGCNLMCKGCGSACETACDSFGQLCGSPFSIFVTVAAVFNLPSVYVGLMGVIDEGVTCSGARWLLVHALLSIINIAAAVYMGVAVVREVTLNTQEQEQQRQSPKSAFARAGHLLCYDPFMAVYILVLLGFFCWLWTGAAWSLNGHIHNGCDADGDDDGVAGKVALALGFGWAFIFFGMASLCLGMCCAYCWDSDSNNAANVPYYDQEAATTPYVKAEDAPATTKASVYDSTTSNNSPYVPTVAATDAPASNKPSPPTATAVLF